MNDAEHENAPSRIPDWLAAVLLVKGGAIAISLLIPITPSKKGSTWSPAHVFTADPTYFDRALASFAMTNLIIVAIGLVALVAIKRDRSS